MLPVNTIKPLNGSTEQPSRSKPTAPTLTLIGATTPDDGSTPSFDAAVQGTLQRLVNYQQRKIDNLKSMVSLVEQQAHYDPDKPLSLHAFGQVAGEWLRMQPEALPDILAMHTRLVVDHFLYQLVTDNVDASAIIRGHAGIACADICLIAGAEPPPICNF